MSTVSPSVASAAAVTAVLEADVSLGSSTGRRALAHPGLMIGAAIVALVVLAALLAPWIAPHDPYEPDLVKRLLPPVWDAERGSWEHPLGTDQLGRDYLSRLLFGARISMTIGIGAAAIAMLIGVTLGVCAGFFGGRIDAGVQYLLNCQLALPGLLLTMALVFFAGSSLGMMVLIIGALHWTTFMVVTRSATQQIRSLEYVSAARAVGAGGAQIIVHEVLPNLSAQIIVIFTLEVGSAILAEAALSFLGVGVKSPTPSWGLMIAEGKASMLSMPSLVLLPGAALFLLVVGINLMGDGVRDVKSPESRN